MSPVRVSIGALLPVALLAAALAGCSGSRPLSPRAALEQRRADLQQQLAKDPRSLARQVELARLAFKLGDGLGGEVAVHAALAAGGDAASLRPLAARAAAMQGDGDRAFRILDAGPIAPAMIGEAAWVAGNVHRDNGDLDAARNAFDRAVIELPHESALWVDVARFREANADALGALDAIDYAIELDKANSAALAFKANLVRTQRGLTASIAWYDSALEADPDNAGALIDRAATLGDLGRYRDMLASLRRAAVLVPGDPKIYYLQAVLAARADNFRLARSLLQRTRGQLDAVPGFMLLSAVVELELGGEAVAATWADRLIGMQPRNAAARRLLAASEWASGDADGAAQALAPIVARADADSWSLLLAARIAAERDQAADSEAYLARAAALAPADAEPFAQSGVYWGLARAADADPLNPATVLPAMAAEIANGDMARALARAAVLRDANRGVADAHMLYGDAAFAAGEYDLAVRSFREARALDAGERTTLRLANAQHRAGDLAGTGATVLALRDSQPSSIAADRLAAHLAIDLKHWDDAIVHFDRVRRRIGDRDVVVLRELSKAWAAKGDLARATALIAQAYRLQPRNAEIMQIYADLLDRRGANQDATDLRDKLEQVGV